MEDYTPSPHQIHMYSVDLTVLGREARTGGDLAFVLDVGRPGAPAIAAICLQAKRANLLSEQPVDVSRKNKSYPRGEGQLGALAAFGKLGCAVAYLVYDNHERRALGEPSVPMVKDRTHLSEQETKKLRLDLRTDTVDFAHYLLDIAHRRSRGAFSGTGDPRFAPMLGRLLAGDLDHVVALSPDPEFGARLNRLLAIGNGGPFHPPFHFSWASPGPLDPDAVFKHNVFAD